MSCEWVGAVSGTGCGGGETIRACGVRGTLLGRGIGPGDGVQSGLKSSRTSRLVPTGEATVPGTDCRR